MGQALRRASGRVRAPPAKPPPRPPPRPPRSSPAAAVADRSSTPQDRLGISEAEVTTPTKDGHGVLEERDPSYDEMLKHMAGRIRSKPGGKPEMGEAFIVERYNRPLPKLRSSKPEAGESGHRQLPPGALNVEHIRQIIQLYQGKSDDQHSPLGIEQIAEKFRVEASVVRNIVQFVSLPQDENGKKKTEE